MRIFLLCVSIFSKPDVNSRMNQSLSQGEEVKQIQLFFVPFFFTFDSSGAKQNFGGASQRNKYVYLYKLVFYYKSKELACGLPCAAAAP